MPYRVFGVDEVAQYLHLGRADIEHLVNNREIPFEKVGDRLVFRKVSLDAWASRRILGLEGRGLTEYHQKASQNTRSVRAREAILPDLINPGFIDSALPAKTKASVIREMVQLAVSTGRVNDAKALRLGIEEREGLCSTGLPGGLALLHTRQPDIYLVELPFIVLARTIQKIPFGSPDGGPTNLFFLLGTPDDRLHLHTLARICLMAQKTQMLESLRSAVDAQVMFQALLDAEVEVLPRNGKGETEIRD